MLSRARILLQERGVGKLHEEKENDSIYQNEMNSNEFVMMNGGFNLCDENSCKWYEKECPQYPII